MKDIEDHYPVRRRGERRRLNPNQAGINWLSRQMTEGVDSIVEMSDGEIHDGLRFWRTPGWWAAKHSGHYPGPMFKIMKDAGRPDWDTPRTPCACDDFAYPTRRCAPHADANRPLRSWMQIARPGPPSPSPQERGERLLATRPEQVILEREDGSTVEITFVEGPHA